MGFTIFESSGTFNPGDYGLNIGDLVHLIVVGGGGSGAGTANSYIAGKPGNASSFGSILTAEGGLAPTSNSQVAPQSGSFPGAQGQTGRLGSYYTLSGQVDTVVGSYYGGCGADGWMPGVCKGRSGLPSTIFAYSTFLKYSEASGYGVLYVPQDYQGHTANFVFMNGLITAIPASPQRAGSGGVFAENTRAFVACSGAGGIGYGAGGGGGATVYSSSERAGAGGNSGVIAQKDYVLTSLEAVPVTVGTGGAQTSGYAGGGGADGCVAIFW